MLFKVLFLRLSVTGEAIVHSESDVVIWRSGSEVTSSTSEHPDIPPATNSLTMSLFFSLFIFFVAAETASTGVILLSFNNDNS